MIATLLDVASLAAFTLVLLRLVRRVHHLEELVRADSETTMATASLVTLTAPIADEETHQIVLDVLADLQRRQQAERARSTR